VNAQMPTLLNLLGMAPIAPEGQIGKTIESNDSGAFDLIFQAFMASPVQPNPVNMQTSNIVMVDETSTGSVGNTIAPANEELRSVNQGTTENPEMTDPAVLTNVLSLRTSPFATNIVATGAKNNPVIATYMAPPKMIEAMTTSLPQGTFSVKATTIENGIATFDLASGSDGQSLRVSIPLESIDTQIDSNLQHRGTRSFSGISTNQDGVDIEQLINRAIVTSLTIESPSGSRKAPDADSKLAVEKTQNVIAITTTQQGKTLQLFATPRPAEIVAQVQIVAVPTISQNIVRRTEPRVTQKLMQTPSVSLHELAGGNSPVHDITVTSEKTVEPQNKMTAKLTVTNQWSQQYQMESADLNATDSPVQPLSDNTTQLKVSGDVTDESPLSSLLGGTSHQTEAASLGATHITSSTVAKEQANSVGSAPSEQEVSAPLTLPKDLDMTTVQPGGAKSVTLQLNPEHLGTARVHLTVQDDMVSARVVVNSHHAKAIVEGSLNDLLRQFERANIRVEQIHVAVSGEWQNSEHNRRQFYQAPRPASRFIKDDDGNESITDTVAKLFAPKQSPAFAGLNILA